jgi:hypothetical protein
MPTYSFAEFQCGLVEAGTKRRTIRAPRKRHARVGERLRLTGPMPGRRLLRVAECLGVDDVRLRVSARGCSSGDLNGDPIADLEAFAREDGFEGAKQMGEFFAGLHGPGLFKGYMIRW